MLVYNLVRHTHVAAAAAADSTQYSFVLLYSLAQQQIAQYTKLC